MIIITEEKRLTQLIETEELVIIFFSGSTCQACEGVYKKIEELMGCYSKLKEAEVNIALFPEIGVGLGVYSSPTICLFVQGKESFRAGIHFDLRELRSKISRYEKMLSDTAPLY